jgi:uncharacterized protein GlcG (DUF336 family)
MIELPATRYLSLEAAKAMMIAAETEARKNGWNVSIAICDAGGDLVHFSRFDDAHTASAKIAQGKARTAARFRRPTKPIEESINSGRTAFVTVDATDGLTPLEGGLPIVAGGRVVGGIGVSGVASAQDVQIAAAGLAALGL